MWPETRKASGQLCGFYRVIQAGRRKTPHSLREACGVVLIRFSKKKKKKFTTIRKRTNTIKMNGDQRWITLQQVNTRLQPSADRLPVAIKVERTAEFQHNWVDGGEEPEVWNYILIPGE